MCFTSLRLFLPLYESFLDPRKPAQGNRVHTIEAWMAITSYRLRYQLYLNFGAYSPNCMCVLCWDGESQEIESFLCTGQCEALNKL